MQGRNPPTRSSPHWPYQCQKVPLHSNPQRKDSSKLLLNVKQVTENWYKKNHSTSTYFERSGDKYFSTVWAMISAPSAVGCSPSGCVKRGFPPTPSKIKGIRASLYFCASSTYICSNGWIYSCP